MTDWPSYKRARDLAGAVFPISEAMILQLARQHGVGRKAGRCIVFSIDDVQRLYDVAMPIVRRPKSPFWIIRGTLRGIRLEESTGTDDKKAAEEIRAKREAEILTESVYGCRATATFASAALSYLENGGSKRFLEPIIKHFSITPLAQINQDAIDRMARKLYPSASDATRNRQA